MSVPPFNTLEIYDVLRKHGFNDEQASGGVEALRRVFALPRDDSVDKDMIDAKIRAANTKLKAELLVWLQAAVLVVMAAIVIAAGR